MKIHIARAHEKSNDFACEICPKNFITEKALELHAINMHTKREKAFPCNYCLKTFYNKSDVRRHYLKVHEEEKFFTKCDICCKRLPSNSLNNHVLKYHKNEI